MAAGSQPNPWGEAQRRTRARAFFAAKRPRGAGLPAGKKEASEGFGRRDGRHRSWRHEQGSVPPVGSESPCSGSDKRRKWRPPIAQVAPCTTSNDILGQRSPKQIRAPLIARRIGVDGAHGDHAHAVREFCNSPRWNVPDPQLSMMSWGESEESTIEAVTRR